MSVVRQDTDYAMRVMVDLARHYEQEALSARQLALAGAISYQFACKILQQLHAANLVQSALGSRGGYCLSRPPAQITLRDIIEAVQGPVLVNKCMLGLDKCTRQLCCTVSKKLAELQDYVGSFLTGVTLDQLCQNRYPEEKVSPNNVKA